MSFFARQKKIIPLTLGLGLILFTLAIGREIYEEQQMPVCPWQVRTLQMHVPPYPNAGQPTLNERRVGRETVKELRFQTPDAPPAVIAFYTDQLPAMGWQMVKREEAQLVFRDDTDQPFYNLTLEVVPANTGAQVLITFSFGPCTPGV